jgi:hypothetical protein
VTRGRIAKPENRFVRRALRAEKELWARLDDAVAPRLRSAFMRDAIREKLDRDRAKAHGIARPVAPERPSQE